MLLPLISFLLLAPASASAAIASIDVKEELDYLLNLSRRLNKAVGNDDDDTLEAQDNNAAWMVAPDQFETSGYYPVPESVSSYSSAPASTSVWSDPAFQGRNSPIFKNYS
jgi:hypothetical protein